MNFKSTQLQTKVLLILCSFLFTLCINANAQTKKKTPVKKKTTTAIQKPTTQNTQVKKPEPVVTKPQPVATKKQNDEQPTTTTRSSNSSIKKTTNKQATNYDKTPFHKGSKTFGIGLGAGVGYGYYGSISGLPAIFAIYDHGLIDKNVGPGSIGIGGVLAYKRATYRYGYGGYKATWSNLIVGVRGTWHLNILSKKNIKFDPYGGLMLGIRYESYRDTYYSSNPYYYDPYDDNYNDIYLTGGVFIGAKYNFKPNIGAFAEVGYDITYCRVGVNFNFK